MINNNHLNKQEGNHGAKGKINTNVSLRKPQHNSKYDKEPNKIENDESSTEENSSEKYKDHHNTTIKKEKDFNKINKEKNAEKKDKNFENIIKSGRWNINILGDINNYPEIMEIENDN